jgi:hypothetical protein
MVRYYSMLKCPWSTIFSLLIVRIVHLPAIIALILCIVGATNASSPEEIDTQPTIHVGVILYVVVLMMLIILTFVACLLKQKTEKGEGALIRAVIFAIPFIFVRLLYSLLSTFSHLKSFNLATGSETALLLMSVVQEMIVVLIYIATGLKQRAVPEDAGDTPGQKLAYRFGRGDFGMGKLGLLSIGLAIFQASSTPREENEPKLGDKNKYTGDSKRQDRRESREWRDDERREGIRRSG